MAGVEKAMGLVFWFLSILVLYILIIPLNFSREGGVGVWTLVIFIIAMGTSANTTYDGIN